LPALEMRTAGDVEENAVAAVRHRPRTPAAAPFGETAQRGSIAERIGGENRKTGAIGLGVGERQAGADAAGDSLDTGSGDETPVADRDGGDERPRAPLFSSPLRGEAGGGGGAAHPVPRRVPLTPTLSPKGRGGNDAVSPIQP